MPETFRDVILRHYIWPYNAMKTPLDFRNYERCRPYRCSNPPTQAPIRQTYGRSVLLTAIQRNISTLEVLHVIGQHVLLLERSRTKQ